MSLGSVLKKGASLLTGGGSDLLLTALTAGGALLGNKGKNKVATEQAKVDAANRAKNAQYLNDVNARSVTDANKQATYNQQLSNARRSMAEGLFASLSPDVVNIKPDQLQGILASSRTAPSAPVLQSNMPLVTPDMAPNPTTGSTYDMLSGLLNTTATGLAEGKAVKRAEDAKRQQAFDLDKLLERLRNNSNPAKPPSTPTPLKKEYI